MNAFNIWEKTSMLAKLSQYTGNQKKTTGKFSDKLNFYMVQYVAYKNSLARCPSTGELI
jgi:hypothetical protein